MKTVRGIARIVGTATILAVALVGPAHAQLGGLLGGGKSDESGDTAGSASAFIAAYAESKINGADANSKLAKAVGDTKKAAEYAEEVEAYKSSTSDPEALGKVMKGGTSGDPLESAGSAVLDAEAKVIYVQGLVSLAKAVVKAKEAAGMASDVASSLAGNPLTMGASAKATLSIAKDAPSHLNELTSALSSAVEFGKKQGIEAPSDATNLM